MIRFSTTVLAAVLVAVGSTGAAAPHAPLDSGVTIRAHRSEIDFSHVWDVAAGPDGTVAATHWAPSSLLVASARDLDRVRAVAVPSRDSQPWRIAFAPDGRAIFTEVKGSYDAHRSGGRDQVGILERGRVREMQLPTSRTRRGLYGVAVQANHVYVTAVGKLVKLGFDGRYAEIAAPGAAYTAIASNARRIAFASNSGTVLEVLTAGGNRAEDIALDSPHVRIERLTFCPPDDLWAGMQTERHTAAVGYIGPRGHVQMYDAGPGQLTGIACTSHDNVWFVAQRPDRVGRIIAGRLQWWPLTPGAAPVGLAVMGAQRFVTATRQGFVEIANP